MINKSKTNKIDNNISKHFIHRSMGGRQGDLCMKILCSVDYFFGILILDSIVGYFIFSQILLALVSMYIFVVNSIGCALQR